MRAAVKEVPDAYPPPQPMLDSFQRAFYEAFFPSREMPDAPDLLRSEHDEVTATVERSNAEVERLMVLGDRRQGLRRPPVSVDEEKRLLGGVR